ncbi:Hemicentin-1 [Stylophora pistillata]|uniref:Hemicentin-1 n=1 Tax=Stylophora pistillata TaxID=50429 RepID=A0A2B4RCQ4_STYPI|nr:Hemicentin-1 [Stylophora pistillata]
MNPTVQDFFLEKHVFKMMEIETASACEVNCFIEADCISYNLKPKRNGKYLCELSDSDYETNPKDFRYKEGSVYKSFKGQRQEQRQGQGQGQGQRQEQRQGQGQGQGQRQGQGQGQGQLYYIARMISARSFINEGNLTILNITTQDNGSYVCTATSLRGTKSSSVYLHVHSALKFCKEGVLGPPLVRVVPDIIETVEGRNVTVMCYVTANPMPDRITWNKSNGIISSANGIVNEGNLTILNITTQDNGSYVCTATNPCGTKSSSVHIRVDSALNSCTEGALGPPLVRVVPDIIETVEGRNVTVMCNVTANRKPVRITWNKSEGIISSSIGIVKEGNLTILNISTQDNGSYVCTAINLCGTKSSLVHIRVYSALNFCTEGVLGPPLVRVVPDIIETVEGRNVTVMCNVTANPKPNRITWNKSNGVISSANGIVNEGNLTILNITTQDNGSYVCTATNPCGNKSSSVHIRVDSALNFCTEGVLGLPLVRVVPEMIETVEGRDVTVMCNVTANPKPFSITWKKFHGIISGVKGIVNEGNLTILNISTQDNGSYVCTATNPCGTRSSSFHLRIYSALKFVIKPPSSVTVKAYEALILPCSASSDLTPSILWMYDGNFALPSGAAVDSLNDLTVSFANFTHGGTYTCNATNTFSSIQKSVIVYVKYSETCTSVRANISDVSGDYFIDPDGALGDDPFPVYCNMTDKGGVGVTVVGHDSENRTQVKGFDNPGAYRLDVHYISVTISQLKVLTEASDNCEQFIKYECFHARLVRGGFSWWVSRDGEKMTYWGGSKYSNWRLRMWCNWIVR